MRSRTFSQRIADERLEQVARVCERASDGRIALLAGYSVKTNPHERMLVAAQRHGLYAEVISDDEAALAERCGFSPDRLIYNGPHPAQPRSAPLGFLFADSMEAFDRAHALGLARVVGMRVRPALIRASRFGLPVEDDERFIERLRAVRAPLAVSMHVRRGDFAGATWRDMCEDVMRRAKRFAATGCEVVAFDAGGGWTPEEFDREFPADAQWLLERLHAMLPAVVHVIIEPGQAVATPVESIVTTVLEVRRRPGRIEAVIDLGYGDWPSQHAYVHGFAVERDGAWIPVGRGGDRIAGSTCLEYDFTDGVGLPDDIAAGDRMLVRNAGSYDRSMAFPFGRGALAATVCEELHA